METKGIAGGALHVSPLPFPTKSLPRFLLWVLEGSKSSLDSEQVSTKLPAKSFIIFAVLWFVCTDPKG